MTDPDANHDPTSSSPNRERDGYTNGSASANAYRESPCIFHVYFGACKNMDICKFSHSVKSIASRPASGTTSPIGDDVPHTPSGRSHRGSRPCRVFSSQGSCKWGDRCEFSHEKPKSSASKAANGGDGKGSSNGGSNRGKGPSRPDRSKKNKKATTSTLALTVEEIKVELGEIPPSARIEEIHDDGENDNNDTKEGIHQDNSPGLEYTTISTPPSKESSHVRLTNAPYNHDGEEDNHVDDDRQSSTLRDYGSAHNTPTKEHTKSKSNSGAGNHTFDRPETEGIFVGTVKEREGRQDADAWGWNDTPGGQEQVAESDLKYASYNGGELGGKANNEMDDAWFQGPEDETRKEEALDNASGWDQPPEEERTGEYPGDDNGIGQSEAVDEGEKEGSIEGDSGTGRNQASERQDTERKSRSSQNRAPVAAPRSTPSSTKPPLPTLFTKAQSNHAPSPSVQPQPSSSVRSQPQIPPKPQPPPLVQPKPQPPPPSNAPQISVMSLHWSRFADPTIDPSIPFCKAFAQNKCSSVSLENCKWRHCLTPHEYALLFKDPQPLQLALEKSLIRNDSPENLTFITAPSITLHWSHFADPTCDANIPFCKPYAEHTCPYGNACQFRHCLTLEEYMSLFKDPQPNLIATTSGVAQPAAPSPLDPAHVSGSQAPAQQTAADQPKICVFFRKGTCRNGESCLYYHDGSPSTCPNVQFQGYCDDQGCIHCSSSTTPAVGPAKKACQYWPQGTCKNGDNCPFAHIGEPGAAIQTAEVEESHDAENAAEDNKVSDTWGFSGDATGWDNIGTGDWGDEEKGTEEPKEAATGWGDENRGVATGWNDQNNNNDSGWGQRNNDGGWGNNNRNNDFTKNNWLSNRKGLSDRRNGICHQFLRGRCSFGSACRYSHDVQVGGSGGHAPQDASRPPRSRINSTLPVAPSPTSAAPAPAANGSTYGGRHKYDRGFIEQWGQEVAVSAAGSEAGSPRGRGSSSQRSSRGHSASGSINRSVDHPPSGNGTCQFHLVGRCGLGDACPSSHDPAVAEIGSEVVNDNQDRLRGADEDRESVVRSSVGGRVELKAEEDAWEKTEEDNRDECNRITEVEEIAANYDDANHVVDNKWALDGQWDDPIEVPKEMIKKQQPCLFYGQGFCIAGESCRFLHIEIKIPSRESLKEEGTPPSPQQGEYKDPSETGTRDAVSDTGPEGHAEIDYGHPLVEKSIFGCTVTFDRNCLPEKVVTGTDSHVLLLNGSPDVTEARVHDAVNKYGPIEDIVITQEQHDPGVENNKDGERGSEGEDNEMQELEEVTPPMSRIRVEFKEMKDAAAAARDLNAILADAVVVEAAPPTSNWVKFRWPQATRAAWVYYSTVTRAKAMAEKLHDIIFQDRKITASFLRPDKRQKDLYAIKLERLPGSTTKGDLDDIVLDAKLVTMSELTYLDDPREVLQQCDGLKNFVGIPEDPSKLNAMAFARFDSEESVLRALQMHGVKHKFLGKQELVVEGIWFAHYILPTTIFKPISAEVTALHIRCEGRANAEYSEVGEHTMIYLYARPEEDTAFAKANLSLQAICNGTVIKTTQNQPEWDEYFYTISSTKVVENLNSKNNFYIFSNASTRQIHSLGSGRDQDKGVSTIKKLLQKVRGSWKEYPIHRNTIRQLLDGGLFEIQGEVGINKISLDVIRSALIIRGGDEVVTQKFQHVLAFTPPSKNSSGSVHPSLLCPICELQPNNDDANPPVELSCRHVYCTACLQHALISATHDHSAPIKCIGRASSNSVEPVCDQPIAYTTVRDLLPLLVEPEYLKITFASFVLSNPREYFFCPSLRCDAVYRRGEPGDTVRCPICRAWVCLFCGSMTHDGMKCKEAQEARKLLYA